MAICKSEVHKSGHRTIGHRVETQEFLKKSLGPVVICPYLRSSEQKPAAGVRESSALSAAVLFRSAADPVASLVERQAQPGEAQDLSRTNIANTLS